MDVLRGLGRLGKVTLITVLLTFLMFICFMFIDGPAIGAERYDACQKRLAKADHKLHEAIEDHGYRTKEAARARQNLRATRERCWSTHRRWWDEHERRWRTERDWDDNDHERYRRERP